MYLWIARFPNCADGEPVLMCGDFVDCFYVIALYAGWAKCEIDVSRVVAV